MEYGYGMHSQPFLSLALNAFHSILELGTCSTSIIFKNIPLKVVSQNQNYRYNFVPVL